MNKESKNRVFHRYEKWECYKNGMYGELQEELIEKCVDLFRSQDGLVEAMRHTSTHWKNSAAHNLSKDGKRYRAWLGQSACCFEIGASEETTRKAWGMLSSEERIIANRIADSIKEEWENA